MAESVETEEILRLTADFGIDYAQGFHIAYPAPDLWRPHHPWPPNRHPEPTAPRA